MIYKLHPDSQPNVIFLPLIKPLSFSPQCYLFCGRLNFFWPPSLIVGARRSGRRGQARGDPGSVRGLAGPVYNIMVSSLNTQLLLNQDSMRSLLIFLGKYSYIHVYRSPSICQSKFSVIGS